jgi:hypothetical protein
MDALRVLQQAGIRGGEAQSASQGGVDERYSFGCIGLRKSRVCKP